MLNEKKVYIYDSKMTDYPKVKPYHPSVEYPEYPFPNYSSKKNEVYNSIRELFKMMKLDKPNIDKRKWNPLKKIVKPGDSVVVKPNMVIHEEKNRPMESLITHGSVIRAVVDYVYIALKGKGKIIVADAPIQSCDFEKVIDNNGTKAIVNFYKEKGFDIELVDFRQEQAEKIENLYIKIEKKLKGDQLGYTTVKLGENSTFSNIEKRKYTITNYDPKIMKDHHAGEKHNYLIPNSLLQADVIINLPKPKTHRKAGITASMKNLVGISGNKAWLPHHSIGSLKENGDEYLNKNIFKRISGYFKVRRDLYSLKGNLVIAKRQTFYIRVLDKMARIIGKKEKYREGSWWGNDTIWRTVCDLNKIAFYADKKGKITNKIQRKNFIICDMIISGEKEGPVEPSPKKVGILVSGESPLIIDTVIATIMGFDYKKIPNIFQSYNIKKLPLTNIVVDDIKIISNKKEFQKKLNNIKKKDMYNFVPTAGWAKHIEKEEQK